MLTDRSPFLAPSEGNKREILSVICGTYKSKFELSYKLNLAQKLAEQCFLQLSTNTSTKNLVVGVAVVVANFNM